jgi:hypothetical protein
MVIFTRASEVKSFLSQSCPHRAFYTHPLYRVVIGWIDWNLRSCWTFLLLVVCGAIFGSRLSFVYVKGFSSDWIDKLVWDLIFYYYYFVLIKCPNKRKHKPLSPKKSQSSIESSKARFLRRLSTRMTCVWLLEMPSLALPPTFWLYLRTATALAAYRKLSRVMSYS